MLFNSLSYLIFFPIVVGGYFFLPFRWRWAWLLAASYLFYMTWEPIYVVLILGSTAIDYFAARRIASSVRIPERRALLAVSILTNLGILFTFKYFNFFNDTARAMLDFLKLTYSVPELDFLLPVGISFYTFQSMAYTIGVYQGKAEVERHAGKFALYVAFFPQLVAGPIERSQRLIPQFYEEHRFDLDRIHLGLQLILWGLFKKVVISDRLSIFVDDVYRDPTQFTGLALIQATYLFAFQIYCDFSGYSDIAIGSAQVMGYDLMENFRRPYFSKSIAEFWRRWHISLSTWFRDYVYFPLGGSRAGASRWYANLMVVFVVSGLWHGANWTFVVWGALHGGYMIIGQWTRSVRAWLVSLMPMGSTARKWIRVFITFHLVCFAWIYFRADSIQDAWYITRHLFVDWRLGDLVPPEHRLDFLIALAGIAVMESVHLLQRKESARVTLSRQPVVLRWALHLSLIYAVALFGVHGAEQFIYFQF